MSSAVQPQTAEEEELQLAMALSRSEAESKEKEREKQRKMCGVGSSGSSAHSKDQTPMVMTGMDTTDLNPELARYLNRNYWEKKSESAALAPSAPQVAGPSQTVTSKVAEQVTQESTANQAQVEKIQFITALQSSLEIFVNRMRSNSQRGRPIANDSSVQSLFSVISSMHPQLMKYMQETEDRRAFFEGLQDKLAQLRDAREALNSLREEHQEKKRREMEELERLRQMQMMQKLEDMRHKKHEYLEMQRQEALQRLQEQEKEMAQRLEQQKQLAQMRQMQTFGYPQGYGVQQPMPHGMMPQQNMPGAMPGPSGAGTTQNVIPGGYPTQPMPQYPPGAEMPAGSGGLPQNLPMLQQQPSLPPTAYSQVPGGYQPPGQIPGQGPLQMNGQAPPGSYGAPPGSMGYMSMLPTMDSGSFNLQSMANALPQQQQQQPGAANPPAPGQEHYAPPQPGQYPSTLPENQSNNQMVIGLPAQYQQPVAPPPQMTAQAQQDPAEQAQSLATKDAQLISFD